MVMSLSNESWQGVPLWHHVHHMRNMGRPVVHSQSLGTYVCVRLARCTLGGAQPMPYPAAMFDCCGGCSVHRLGGPGIKHAAGSFAEWQFPALIRCQRLRPDLYTVALWSWDERFT